MLLPLMQQYVRPGSIVYSDGWRAYSNLANHGYAHNIVVHQDNFIDPVTSVHTQGVKAYWFRAKQKIKAFYGSGLPLIPSYLDEFVWQEHYRLNLGEASPEHVASH